MSDKIRKNKEKESIPIEQLVEHEFDKFKEVVNPTDSEVTMILRAHLLAEYYINRLIEAELSCGYFITKEKITFYNKLIIIKAFGIPIKGKEGVCFSLSGLNNLRNSCAHVINYKISENDIDKIGLPLGRRYTQLKFEPLKNLKSLLYRTLGLLLINDLAFIVNYKELEKCGKTMKLEEDKSSTETHR